ncbi:MAG: DNA-binding NtrC family response regulator [Myxococcota bacterium]|jgi:DNA-binding NtrC family response regulator
MSDRSHTRTPMAVTGLRASSDVKQPGEWMLLVAASPARAGRRVALGSKVLRVGRDPDPDAAVLVLDDKDISRNHATFSAGPGGVRVVDIGSTNGTHIAGRRVLDTTLESGGVVRMGSTVVLAYRGLPDAPVSHEFGLVGSSLAMSRLRETIRLASKSSLPVLVIGETGAGKEVISSAFHSQSQRRGELVTLNCGALPSTLMENALFGHKRGAYTDARTDEPGAFARADGGTLFLDEIGEMALEAQPKLLRVLESGDVTPLGSSQSIQVDVRIVAATNRPLLEAVEEGVFREDLYARLAGIVLQPPPLRARREDIMTLFQHFLPADSHSTAVSADFVEAMLRYDWPRNVRELKRVAERLPVLNPGVTCWQFDMLDDTIKRAVTEQPITDDQPAVDIAWPPTRDGLVELLRRSGGNVSRAAEAVGRNRKQLYRWMEKLGVDAGVGR